MPSQAILAQKVELHFQPIINKYLYQFKIIKIILQSHFMIHSFWVIAHDLKVTTFGSKVVGAGYKSCGAGDISANGCS